MPIPVNPANALASDDIRNYRDNFESDPEAKLLIRGTLNGRDPGNYPPGKPDNEFLKLDVFSDFVAWDGVPGPVRSQFRRLGGTFPAMHPNPVVPPPTGPTVPWPPNSQNPTQIEINADGAINHTTGTPAQIRSAHEYMHWIFNDILFQIRRLLEEINIALETYMETPNPTTSNTYTVKVTNFGTYEASLQPGGSSPYSTALRSARISPVTTNEGFIVSVRIDLDWKNPVHSSSTVKVP